MNESKSNLGGNLIRTLFASVELRIVLVYASVASLWILLSDWLVTKLVTDFTRHQAWETAKGWLFVAVTALMLYSTLKRRLARIQKQISAREDAEAALRISEERFRMLVKLTPLPLARTNKSGDWTYFNDRFTQVFGYTAADVPTLAHWWPLAYPDPDYRQKVINRWQSEFDQAGIGNTETKPAEFNITCKDGRVRVVEVSCMGFNEDVVAVFLDVTERKQAEASLRKSEALHRSLFQNMLNGFAFCRMEFAAGGEPVDFTYLQVNEAFEKLTGFKDVVGKRVSEVIPGIHETDSGLLEAYSRVVRTGVPEKFEIHLKSLNVWFSVNTYRPIPDHFVAIIDVITQRKQAEEQLRKLSHAVEQSPASVVITDLNGHIEYVNPKFTTATGYTLDEVRGKNPRLLKSGEMPPEKYEFLWRTITSGKEWRGEFHNRRKNGELFWEFASISPIVDATGKTTHYLSVKEDITERKNADIELHKLEEEFRQAQKMRAVGQLASGVAHDFNNLLTVIQGHCTLMRAHEKFHPQLGESVIEIAKASERAANLTRQLLAFSRRQPLQLRDLDFNEVVNNTTKMLQRILGEDIALQVNYSTQSLFIHADTGMLDQILLNLAVNSRDAMPKGGRLIIEIAPVEIDKETAARPSTRAGSFVRLSVSDTGCGISPDILPLIFEPFFTTKIAGNGTGLGLATVYGIVLQHQGWITAESEPGRGTSFHLYFPRVQKHAVAHRVEPATTVIPNGNETILLAEDYSAVRTLVCNVLKQLGYRILEAPTGVAALQVWKENRAEIRLLLTDLVMPDGMTGIELAKEIARENPRLPVIYISGYSPEIAGREVPLREGENFLAKPFSPQKLAQTVRESLDAARR